MSGGQAGKAIRLLNKCLWQGGADDIYRASYRQCLRTKASTRMLHASTADVRRRQPSSNPMLNGVSMLQWFFDEVRPDQREVRYWMKYFSQATDPSKPFAVIQICEDVFAQEELDKIAKDNGEKKRTILETLSLSMYFLQQNKMNTVLLVGSSEKSQNHAHAKRIRKEIYANIKNLVDKLEESGTKSSPIFDGGHIFNTSDKNEIHSMNTDQIDWLISHMNIPVIGCIGESSEGQLAPVSLDEAHLKLSEYTTPLKVLLLNSAGGITDENGQRITTVFLPKAAELKKFVNQPWWSPETENRLFCRPKLYALVRFYSISQSKVIFEPRDKTAVLAAVNGNESTFQKVCEILNVLPKQSSYVITSASDLLTELLTQRGVGTMFKKVVPVTKYTSLEETVTTGEMMGKKLKDILPTLLESTFEQMLSNDYWHEMPSRLHAIYLTEDLKSCAIVFNVPDSPTLFYLDKFAVSKGERGNFNTEVLWQQLKHDYDQLFWRSRHNNVINSWYEARSDGTIKMGFYHLFWYGMAGQDINLLIRECEKLPNSFISSA